MIASEEPGIGSRGGVRAEKVGSGPAGEQVLSKVVQVELRVVAEENMRYVLLEEAIRRAASANPDDPTPD